MRHPSWQVRLHACSALAALGAVDADVMRTVDEIHHSPEGEEWNRCVERSREIAGRFGMSEPGEPTFTTAELLHAVRRAS
ncbi:MAG: hypothetical protein ACP5VE_12285 [Chthonomonadales bacterium]